MEKRQHRTHDFTRFEYGHDYAFEPLEEGRKGYMTGQGYGVRCGDYLVLQCGAETYRYQIEKIDYYSNPSNMWIALLKQVISD